MRIFKGSSITSPATSHLISWWGFWITAIAKCFNRESCPLLGKTITNQHSAGPWKCRIGSSFSALESFSRASTSVSFHSSSFCRNNPYCCWRWVMSAVPLNLMCLPNLNYLFLWMSHSLGKISFFISCNYNAFPCLYTEILNIRKPILIYINYTHLLVNVSTERWSKEGICRQKNASENSFHYYFPSIIVPLLLFHD